MVLLKTIKHYFVFSAAYGLLATWDFSVVTCHGSERASEAVWRKQREWAFHSLRGRGMGRGLYTPHMLFSQENGIFKPENGVTCTLNALFLRLPRVKQQVSWVRRTRCNPRKVRLKSCILAHCTASTPHKLREQWTAGARVKSSKP